MLQIGIHGNDALHKNMDELHEYFLLGDSFAGTSLKLRVGHVNNLRGAINLT